MRYFTLQNRISSLGTDEDKACSSIEGFCVLFCFAVALLFNSLIFLEYSEAKVFSSWPLSVLQSSIAGTPTYKFQITIG